MKRIAAAILGLVCAYPVAAEVMSLHGEWAFKLDTEKSGVSQKWFETALPDKTRLPGSTDENHFGTPNTRQPDYNYLSRLYEYTGPAWYQREVDIPANWTGKHITLFLERCHWETRVWVDGQDAGMRNSLCVPHVYDLSALLTPGKHRLTLCVDNTLKLDMGAAAHSTSEQTQTNWNGIIGRVELKATDPVWIESAQVYPDVDGEAAKVKVTIGNATGKPVSGNLALVAITADGAEEASAEHNTFSANEPLTTVEVVIPMHDCLKLWDEFSPTLYELNVTLTAWRGFQSAHTDTKPDARIEIRATSTEYSDSSKCTFGMRKLVAEGKQLKVNGRTIFLRGTLECCIFPKTGYPPTDVKDWLRIIRIAKSYGLNHLRFHSWCPPEAAFAAGDQEGFLFHVEAPQWVQDAGKVPPRDQFIEEEVKRILDTYGNHPSFGMLCMGNELGGDKAFLQKLVRLGQERDKRHLYTPATAWSFGEADDYNVWHVPRGLHGPTTDKDFRDIDAKLKTPVISHEIGQWTVYPNLDEIKKYDGVLRARNFELIRDDLAAKHLIDQAPEFTRASGLLMVLLYKEEIESQLRTPGHAGFQLLDLHDFPGQGTALIGTLDPFWDSKGLITPEQFRRYCGPTVPLLRLSKRTFTTDETLKAGAEIAHYGPGPIEKAEPFWTIVNENGGEIASGAFTVAGIPSGALSALGAIEVPLEKAAAPAKLTVTVGLKGTEFSNSWDIWVYPPIALIGHGCSITEDWDEASTYLDKGRSVLLLAARGILNNSLPGSFTPVFWSPIWFKSGAGTMGILCDPKHPALAHFPTEMHTNWQWYDLLQNSAPMILDDMPLGLRPIVQVIDNFSRNHKLGVLFEARVGKGRLLVCSMDLRRGPTQRPEVWQMLASLSYYVDSPAFDPTVELDEGFLAKMFHPSTFLKSMMHGPRSMDNAKLRVKAAVKTPEPNKAAPWLRAADDVLAQADGFDYVVHGMTWRDSVGAAWHDGSDLRVVVTCPKGFAGTLYAHFHDWNNLNRVAHVFFQGSFLGTIDNYNGPGVWLAIPVTAQDSVDGKLTLSSEPEQVNTMITQIVLMKEEK